jgi:hypothetical protein
MDKVPDRQTNKGRRTGRCTSEVWDGRADERMDKRTEEAAGVDKGMDNVAGENGAARAGVPLTGTLRGGYCYARVHLATFKHSILRPSRYDTRTSGSCLSYLLIHPVISWEFIHTRIHVEIRVSDIDMF